MSEIIPTQITFGEIKCFMQQIKDKLRPVKKDQFNYKEEKAEISTFLNTCSDSDYYRGSFIIEGNILSTNQIMKKKLTLYYYLFGLIYYRKIQQKLK